MQKSLSSGLIPLSTKERTVGGSASRRKQPNINDDDDDLDMDSMLNDIMSSSDKKTKSKTSTSSSFSPYGRGGAEGPTFSSFSPKLKRTEVALQDEDDHFSFDESDKSPSPPPISSTRLGAASPSFSRRSRPASKPAASIDSSPSSVHTSTASTLRQEGFSSTLESRPSIPARSPAEDDLFNDDFDLDDDIFGDILGTKTKAKSKPLATSKSIDSLRTSDIQIGSAEKEKVSSSRPRTAPSSVISNKAIDLGEENATVGSDGPELGFVPSFFDGERRSRRTLGRQDSKSDIQVSKSLDMFTSDDSLAPRKVNFCY